MIEWQAGIPAQDKVGDEQILVWTEIGPYVVHWTGEDWNNGDVNLGVIGIEITHHAFINEPIGVLEVDRFATTVTALGMDHLKPPHIPGGWSVESLATEIGTRGSVFVPVNHPATVQITTALALSEGEQENIRGRAPIGVHIIFEKTP